MPEPFSCYSPPAPAFADAGLLLLGEAPGEEEVKQGKPFVGPSGKLLDDLLKLAGMDRSMFHCTNVISQRPPGNDIKAFTLTKTDLKKQGFSEVGRLPRLQGRYLHPQWEPELGRLASELAAIRPLLIICLGGTAQWAISADSRITQFRGAFFCPIMHPNMPAWPQATAISTFHPAAVLREYSLRPIVWADLRKARMWLDGTLPQPQHRRIYINPTEAELQHAYSHFAGLRTQLLGVDIETSPAAGQITSFAIGTAETVICIPLWNPHTLPSLCHAHATVAGEVAAWGWIRRFCNLPNPKVLQNGLYDLQWLMDQMQVYPVNVLHDTAILQNTLQPELPKDLGTLGSLYLNEPAWKFMRAGKEEAKADE